MVLAAGVHQRQPQRLLVRPRPDGHSGGVVLVLGQRVLLVGVPAHTEEKYTLPGDADSYNFV